MRDPSRERATTPPPPIDEVGHHPDHPFELTAAGARPEAPRFEIVVRYREPGYARERGIAEVVYTATYIVRARTEEEAVGAALREFDDTRRLASVSWARPIEQVTASRISDPSDPA